MEGRPETTANARFAVLSLLCTAFLFSLAVYVAVAWFLLRSEQPALPPGSTPPALPWVLTAVAFMLLVAGHVLGRRSVPSRLSPPPDAFVALQQRTIIAFALREAAAIMGLVLSLLTGDIRWVAGFAAAAALAMLMGWPRRSALEVSPRTGPPPIG